MFETLSYIKKFYINETKSLNLFHKFLTISYYLGFEVLSLFIPRNSLKYIFRHYIKFGFIRIKLRLKDRIIINHFLESYGLFFEILLDDEYDLKKLNKNSVIVDVGANIGLVSVIASKRYKAKKVISFEPSSGNFSILSKNIKENGCTNIVAKKMALSDKKGEIRLYLHGSGTHSINPKKLGRRFENVKTSTLDDELKKEKKIDLLKIDVEGAELDVIKGASKTLTKTAKVILEWSELCSDKEIIQILTKNKFNVKIKKNLLYASKS